MKFFKSITKNENYIKDQLNDNQDIVFRKLKFKNNKFLIVYIQNMVDTTLLSETVIEPLIESDKSIKINTKYACESLLTIGSASVLNNMAECLKSVLEGDAVLFVNDEDNAIKLNISNIEKRTITEPPTSAVVYGPREGFVENIKINTSLIRKRLPTTSLKMEELIVGNYTKTKVRVLYLKDIANDDVVERVVTKIKGINIDGVVDSHYLVSFLEEKKDSIFKQVGKTEKPDIITAKLLEGRVAILVDGSPIVLTLPFILLEDIQNSDDYYQKSFKIAFIRLVRIFGILFSIILPGLYVAIQTQHYRIVPVKFLTTLMDSIQGLPFTPFLEILFVILLFEILYESGLRMPKYLGVALGVVGALILGDTAVKAGLISPPAVMLVALSGISFYTIPDASAQLSFLRLVFTVAGGVFGIMGIMLMFMFLVSYLNDINSYGSPYLAPYAPRIKQDLYDAIIKKETAALNTRPLSIPSKKKLRLDEESSLEEEDETINN